MLILARKKNESIIIGGNPQDCIEVKVLDLRGSSIKLGFICSRDISIERGERYKKFPTNLKDTPEKNFVNIYEQFKHHLDNQDYIRAYEIFSKFPLTGEITYNDLLELSRGLGELVMSLQTKQEYKDKNS